MRILYPAFASVKDASPATQSLMFYSAGRPIRLLYSVAAGGFVACAPLIIQVLYDDRFSGAALFLQILAVGNLVSMSTASANQMLIALGYTWHIFRLNVTRLIFFGASGASGLVLFGPLGLVAAVVATELAAQVYCWVALSRMKILRFHKEMPYLLATALGIGIGWCVNVVGISILT